MHLGPKKLLHPFSSIDISHTTKIQSSLHLKHKSLNYDQSRQLRLLRGETDAAEPSAKLTMQNHPSLLVPRARQTPHADKEVQCISTNPFQGQSLSCLLLNLQIHLQLTTPIQTSNLYRNSKLESTSIATLATWELQQLCRRVDAIRPDIYRSRTMG
jgi:hypothetical protein